MSADTLHFKIAPPRKGPGPGPAVAYVPHQDVLIAQTQDALLLIMILRFANAISVRTFFQPDEYFQVLEPAWNIAFGSDSGAWLTWEWQHQLRSSLHPWLFAGVYVVTDSAAKLLHPLPALRAAFLGVMPNVVQGLFAGLSDFYTWKLAEKIFGRSSDAAWAALLMSIFNPWQWYCSTRTFSNALEMTLTVMALNYWPWKLLGEPKDGQLNALLRGGNGSKGFRLSLLFAALAVVLRPTNLLIWSGILTLVVTRMSLDGKSPMNRQTLVALVGEILLCGTVVLGLSAVSDYLYFGFWTFPQYNWLHFNLSQALAVFYGRNPWHYYLLQGIPLLTTTFVWWAVVGIVKPLMGASTGPVQQRNTLKTLSFVVITTVAALSIISHKEVRFIYPLLPILHVLAAPHINAFFTEPSPSTSASSAAPTTTLIPGRKPLLIAMAVINVLLAAYLSLLHQRAPLGALDFVRSEYERVHWSHVGAELGSLEYLRAADIAQLPDDSGEGDELFALFLMPCHSTPWRSRLVYPGLRARALTCEPPLHTEPGSPERAAYLDEADRFYAPTTTAADGTATWGAGFLAEEMWPLLTAGGDDDDDKVRVRGGELPRYIVGFEGIGEMLTGFFETGDGKDMGVSLRPVWTGWNGLFNEDWRRQGKMVVWDTGVYPDGKERMEE